MNYFGIVNYGAIDDVERTLMSLTSTCRIIIVDNFSTAEERSRIKGLESKFTGVTVITSANHGFAAGVNLITSHLRRKKVSSVIILNPDIEILNIKHFITSVENSVYKKLGRSTAIVELEVHDGIHHQKQSRTMGFYEIYSIYNGRKLPNYNRIKGAAFAMDLKYDNEKLLWCEDFFMYVEEIDFSHRLIRSGFNIATVNFKNILRHHRPSYKASSFVQFYLMRNLYLYSKNAEHGTLLIKNKIFITIYLILKNMLRPKMWKLTFHAVRDGTSGKFGNANI